MLIVHQKKIRRLGAVLNNKKKIIMGIIYGGVIGVIIGIITILGQHNDNFVYIYAAPFYIYSYMFNGTGSENVAIFVYYLLIGLCTGYACSVIKLKKDWLIISSIILLHIALTIFGVRTISKDLREFLDNMPVEMIVDSIPR